jgi:hypothetical protein
VNLAYNNEGAYSFRFTLEDYRSLQYDLVIFYEGYNDMMGEGPATNTSVFRRTSPVFRLTGYFPILPVVLREKAMAIRYGGDVDAGYRAARGDKVIFKPPSLARRTAGAAMDFVANAGERLGDQLAKGEPKPDLVDGSAPVDGCQSPWRDYCRSIGTATEYALTRGASVVVVTQPYSLGELRKRHEQQQQSMAAMLKQRFSDNPRVRRVDLGDAVDLADPGLSYDRMHLTAAGNRIIAERLADPVAAMMAQRKP